MRGWFTTGELLLAAMVAIALAAGATVVLDTPASPTAADDWRRTAHGWERAHQWRAPGVVGTHQRPLTPSSGPRYDSHPAVIALAQLTAVLVALAACAPSRTAAGAQASAVTTHIAESFRASAFGS